MRAAMEKESAVGVAGGWFIDGKELGLVEDAPKEVEVNALGLLSNSSQVVTSSYDVTKSANITKDSYFNFTKSANIMGQSSLYSNYPHLEHLIPDQRYHLGNTRLYEVTWITPQPDISYETGSVKYGPGYLSYIDMQEVTRYRKYEECTPDEIDPMICTCDARAV